MEEINHQQEPCRLLSLPSELRNMICEYALFEPNMVSVTSQYEQPALLATCWQLQKEALLLYYSANTFFFEILDCDSTLYIRFIKSIHQTLHNQKAVAVPASSMNLRVAMTLSGAPVWDNLKQWCRSVCCSNLPCFPGIPMRTDMPNVHAVMVTALNIARKHRGRQWEECEAILEDIRSLAGILDRRWSN